MKYFVDILSSIASVVAIVGMGIGWYRSARKPLKIIRVVVHLNKVQSNSTFILAVKNLSPNSVIISRCEMYSKKKHEVRKKGGGSLEYSEIFSSADNIFSYRPNFEVAASGQTDLRVHVDNEKPQIPRRMLFLLETTHGVHELRCRRIITVEMEQAETYRLEYHFTSGSKMLAKLYYFKTWASGLTRCS